MMGEIVSQGLRAWGPEYPQIKLYLLAPELFNLGQSAYPL